MRLPKLFRPDGFDALGIVTAVACAALAGPARAGAPGEAAIQGFYEGVARSAAGERLLEARVVDCGKGAYKVLVREDRGGGDPATAGKVARVELDGRMQGGRVVFEGKGADAGWEGVCERGEIRGRAGGGGELELARVDVRSPTLGREPPPGAVVLLDGADFTRMVRSRGAEWYVGDMEKDGWGVWEVSIRAVSPGEPAERPSEDNTLPEGWELGKKARWVDSVLGVGEDGSVQVPKGGMGSKRRFEGSFDAHVEFMCPLRPEQRSQGRGNSGFFLPCGTEIQVLDSFGMTTYKGGGCGGLYKWKDPDAFDEFSLASYPPLTWQTYDVEYRVRKDANGKPTGYLTARHNGVLIHDEAKLQKSPRKGNFSFQDHGNPVRYRNIWAIPVEKE